MMQDYEMVIGLEVHVELKTNTKIFCRCAEIRIGQINGNRKHQNL